MPSWSLFLSFAAGRDRETTTNIEPSGVHEICVPGEPGLKSSECLGGDFHQRFRAGFDLSAQSGRERKLARCVEGGGGQLRIVKSPAFAATTFDRRCGSACHL